MLAGVLAALFPVILHSSVFAKAAADGPSALTPVTFTGDLDEIPAVGFGLEKP